MENTRKTDMEFVTKVTNDTCVKYLLAEVKFSRIYAKKNYSIRKLCQIQARVLKKQLE